VLSRERGASDPAVLALAGAFASLAAWTKVEGFLLVLGLLAAAGLTGGGGLALRLRRKLWVALGAAPALGLLAYVNSAYVRVDSEYAQPMPVMFASALTWGRHVQILSAAWKFVAAPPQWPALSLLALAGVISALGGFADGWKARRPILVVLAPVAAGFYAVYLTTPYPLQWQLDGSLNRLFIQYWPALVLLAFVGGFGSLDRLLPDLPGRAPARGAEGQPGCGTGLRERQLARPEPPGPAGAQQHPDIER
jgi:hypothetical protein